VILAAGVLALVAVAVMIWISVGRDVLRVGYVRISEKPSPEGPEKVAASDPSNRHEGVLHLVMVDHVDPELVLVVLRLDGGGQWISTVRADQQGFGTKRLDSWRAAERRVVIVEKPGGHEVIFRPVAARRGQPVHLALPQRINSVRTAELIDGDVTPSDVNAPEEHTKPIPRRRLLLALTLGWFPSFPALS
jgi:hypothetical protein